MELVTHLLPMGMAWVATKDPHNPKVKYTEKHRELDRNLTSNGEPPPQTSPTLLGSLSPHGTPAEMRKYSLNIFVWFSSVYEHCLQTSKMPAISEIKERRAD